MPKSSEGYLYRVGWLGVEVDDSASVGGDAAATILSVKETFHVLGDYKAQTPKGAIEAAVEDFPQNGGIPNMAGQKMVAVVRSKWYEFDAGARQETVWEITETKPEIPADPPAEG